MTFRHLTLLAFVALLAPTAFGQGVTTAAINGLVTDDGGQPLPGANVVAVHQPTGTEYGTITRSDGRFNMPNLQVGGPYTVTASFIGYRPTQEAGFSLALGENRTLNLRLREDTAELGEIVVTGAADATFNENRSGASTNVSTEQIEALPSISRSIQDFTRLSPQVAGNNVGGRNNRYNNIQLDGAILNDAFGLPASGTPGGQVGAQPVSLDAIAEFQVEAAPYDVRRSGFTGGLINAVTRRGTNAFEGSAYFFGQNQAFVGLSPDDQRERLEDFGDLQTGFRLGGPILRNELFFFASGEIRQRDQPASGGLLGSGAATEFVAGQDVIDQITEIARGYGLEPGSAGAFTSGTGDAKLFGRLDWNINAQNRLTLRHNFVDAAADRGLGRGRTSWTLTDQNYAFRSRQNSTVLQLNSTVANNLFTEARLGYTSVRDSRDYGNATPAPAIFVRVPGGGTVNLGQERSSQQNALDQDILEITANATLFSGALTYTFGTDNQYTRFSNLFLQDFYGTYNFDSIEDFAAGRPQQYRHTYAAPGFPDAPRAEWGYFRAGGFAQAEWRAMAGLNLTGGLRMDVPFFLDTPPRNEAFEQARVGGDDGPLAFPGLRTDRVPSGNPQISPRLAFNWDVFGERATQVRGGVGIFSGPPLGVWLSNQYSNTGVDLLRVSAFNRPAGFFTADPFNQPRPGTTAGLSPIATTGIALTSEDFTFPQVLRVSLGVDQRLPVLGLVATAEVQHSPTVNDVFFENVGLGRQTGTNAVDGRPIFARQLHPSFTNVILLRNTDQGHTTNVTFQLERPARDGIFGTLAYNFQQSRDVNSGGSSVAFSNWANNATAGDPNAAVVASSLYEVPHRVLAAFSYRADLLGGVFNRPGFASTFSVILDGSSGLPYSYIYNGDVNGDGVANNDLMFVPRSQDDIVISDENWATLNAYIESSSYLSSRRGQIVDRNGARAPWSNRLDLRLAQEVPTVRGQRFEVTLDILNAMNLLNADWGRLETVGWTHQLMVLRPNNQGGPVDAEGRPVVTSVRPEAASVADLASRWQMQLGLRYSF